MNGAAHWADRVAEELAARGVAQVVSSGISPSGEIHIGNLREVLTADAVYRALVERGIDVRFDFVADNYDPLRRVYAFLDPQCYAPLVGRPLAEIPCPCGEHPNYGEHFLAPFIAAMQRLRVGAQVVRGDELYKSGKMNPYIVRALEARDAIAAILQELTGKAVAPDWTPFNPACPSCGRIQSARVTGFSAAGCSVDYLCACGAEGTLPMAGGGKLTWRVDWPARWALLGVTVEPFGKDHATRGGSYDTGERLAREVFGAEPPYPVPYEWIRLKNAGDMSSSRGNVLSTARMLEVVPPEVLRYLVLRERLQRTIDFDPGLALLRLVDEVDDRAAKGRDERALELSMAAGFQPVGVPFKHLVVVAQATGFDASRCVEVLRRTGYPDVDAAAVGARLDQARRWLADFAPDDLRFEVQSELPAAAADLSAEQRRLLGVLADRLTVDADAETIHQQIYALLAEPPAARPAVLFEAIYLSLLGKKQGPRAGWFIELLGAEFCAARFREAATVQS